MCDTQHELVPTAPRLMSVRMLTHGGSVLGLSGRALNRHA
jgi:hypothetical protein